MGSGQNELNRADTRDSQLRQLMDGLPNISGFNYRIARHKVGDDAYYRIHECFYDENGRVVLWGESSPHRNVSFEKFVGISRDTA
jgi:hypothetical protein